MGRTHAKRLRLSSLLIVPSISGKGLELANIRVPWDQALPIITDYAREVPPVPGYPRYLLWPMVVVYAIMCTRKASFPGPPLLEKISAGSRLTI